MTAKAPNILIVMADQMAPAFLPIYGHPLVRAPNMEALARDGIVFDSAYCASPLCAPSRASFMSGLLPSRTRVYDNAAEFAADIPTFAHGLAGARLSHHPLRQDALLRARSAAWIRAAADDRHLSRRLQLDAGLGSPGASPELVSQHELGSRRGLMRALEPARLRRRGRLHGRAGDLRSRAFARSAAFPARRPRSRIRTTRSPFRSATGTSTATRTSTCRRPGMRSIRIRAACATFARWIPSR